MAEILKAVKPAEYMPSYMANPIEKRYWELDEARAVRVEDLFPTISKPIYNAGDDLKIIEETTRKSLENVDMSMIKPGDRVNITASEHGFSVVGGLPYLTMIKTIIDVLGERTGNFRPRVVLAMYRLPEEADEVINYFDLKNYFGCEVVGTCPFEDGVGIETCVGKLYGNSLVYDCDWMIYAYYDDPREQYLHRGVNRLFKSFVMNFARVETRTAFHMLSTGRNAGVLSQAIYDSEFVQSRWAFATIMNMSPAGVRTIDSDNSLYELEKRSIVSLLKDYTMIRLLFTRLDPWVAIWDGGRWGCYLTAAGTIYGVAATAGTEFFDLDIPYSIGKEKGLMAYSGGKFKGGNVENDSLKAFIQNQSWIGLCQGASKVKPCYCVGQEQYDMWVQDRTNQGMMPGMAYYDFMRKVYDTLEDAIDEVTTQYNTKNVIAFDGSYGYINCSQSAAEDIIKKAEGIEDETYTVHLPKYLRQRGFDVEQVYRDIYHREYKG